MGITQTDSGICIKGFEAAGARDKENEKYGLSLIKANKVCAAAGVFTKHNLKAAPLQVTKEKINSKEGIQAIVANSGNANACVKDGLKDAREMCEKTAKKLGIEQKHVAVASTGIIGRRLEMEKIRSLIDQCSENMSSSPENSELAAGAIMTTDTKIKEYSIEYKGIKIGAIAKGSGMVNPNMGTMLCFITTNAALSQETIQIALQSAVEDSFNMLTIDGEISTNDMVLLLSTQEKECRPKDFQKALDHITTEMTKRLAMDGEGSTKYLAAEIQGAAREEDARKAAQVIVKSSLVKTALYGENPNWGRIVAAVGSVIEMDCSKMDIIYETPGRKAKIVEKGMPRDIEGTRKVLKNNTIKIIVDLNEGEEEAIAFGCDLTEEYVQINAEYN